MNVKTLLSSQTVDVPEYVNITPKGHTVIEKGLRGALWRDLNHINVELSLLGKSKRLWVDNGGMKALADLVSSEDPLPGS